MPTLLLCLTAAIAGYVASILTWPRLRRFVIGIENEVDDLRRKARALETKLRG